MLFGVGTIIGGYLSGYLSTKMNVISSGKLAVLTFFICCIYTFYMINCPSLIAGFIGSLLWGLEVYYVEGWLYVACSDIYKGDLESFAIVKQFHSIFFILFQIVLMCVKNLNLSYVMGVFCILALPAYFLLQTFYFDDEEQEISEDSD